MKTIGSVKQTVLQALPQDPKVLVDFTRLYKPTLISTC